MEFGRDLSCVERAKGAEFSKLSNQSTVNQFIVFLPSCLFQLKLDTPI